jgi:hypothetical protein
MLWDCGEHWIAAGEVDRAIAVMKDCSRHLVEIGRPREATEMLLRAASLAGPAGGVDLTEAAVLLGSTAHEHELVLQGVSVLRSFGVPRRHDDIELAEFSSQTLATIDVHAAVERLRECLVSPLSSTEHRLGVAVPLIVLCHQHDLADFAAEAFAILNPLASDLEGGERLDALRFLLIYHSSFGDLDESTTIANELLAADGHWTTEIKSHIHRQAGIALWCAGRPNEAMLALHSAYSLAGERGLRRSQLAIASMCANFHSDLGNDIERDRWLAEADRLATGTAALQTGFDLVSIYIDIASAACDPSEMKKWYEAALEMGRPDGNIRLERWFQTLELLVRHLTGQLDAPTEAVRRLTEWKFGRTVSALADFELATALTIGRECESVDIRSDRLANYLVMRRGRMPLSAMLQGVARDLERERTRATGSD